MKQSGKILPKVVFHRLIGENVSFKIADPSYVQYLIAYLSIDVFLVL